MFVRNVLIFFLRSSVCCKHAALRNTLERKFTSRVSGERVYINEKKSCPVKVDSPSPPPSLLPLSIFCYNFLRLGDETRERERREIFFITNVFLKNSVASYRTCERYAASTLLLANNLANYDQIDSELACKSSVNDASKNLFANLVLQSVNI